MAEGWARHLKSDVLTAYSAGTVPKGLNTLAVRVMKEEGVDISEHTSKSLMDLNDVVFDWVVTVCDNARERCPLFPGRSRVIHVGFDDPPRLAERAVTEAEALFHYRRVRDEIRAFIETLPESFETQFAAAQAAREQSKAARRR